MGRIVRVRDYLLEKAFYLTPPGAALRAYEAGESTLKFDWPNSTADMWIEIITSADRWRVESIEHTIAWDFETDEAKGVVHVTFARVGP